MNTEFYKMLDAFKIKIKWNKNPIKMSLFLSFLTVETEIVQEHLGYSMGWTLRVNKDLKLEIKGGWVDGDEWLDNVQYGTKLQNSCNNYCNPFFYFDILNDDGRRFFVEYYMQDILAIIEKAEDEAVWAKKRMEWCRATEKIYKEELSYLEQTLTTLKS